MSKMNRKLIMIISDGGGISPLKGVHLDEENYLSFFKSPEGGAWEDHEILVYDNNNFNLNLLTTTIMTAKLKGNPIEYFLIVYCGHGFTDAETKEVYLQVGKDLNIKIDDLLAVAGKTRCLIIADSCRAICHLQEGGSIENRRLFCAKPQSATYERLCRDYYNQIISETCSTLQMVVFSNSFNETAEENSRNGGMYSYALLETAKERKRNIETKQIGDPRSFWEPINNIHAIAAEKVKKETNGRQNPEIYKGARCIKRLPFLVVPHWQLQFKE
jgi:hypothetical protein